MTYFIVTYTYGEKDLIAQTRPAHRDFITGLKDAGSVVAAGPFEGDAQSVIIVRLADNATQADAEALLDDDPYLAAGALSDRDFREWSPVINVWD